MVLLGLVISQGRGAIFGVLIATAYYVVTRAVQSFPSRLPRQPGLLSAVPFSGLAATSESSWLGGLSEDGARAFRARCGMAVRDIVN